jgi:DNA-3-methyladenine glycosylase I
MPTVPPATSDVTRCSWALGSPAIKEYHDLEWGVPVRDDRKLFEYLLLDGAQAGLSWSTILNRREGYRTVFSDFDPEVISKWDTADVDQALQSPLIIRNRAKVNSAVRNAAAFLQVVREFGDFNRFFWSFVGGSTIQNTWTEDGVIPAETEESRTLSKDLKARGFSFVGPTIVYAVMQSAGMVNDHLVSCFRYDELNLKDVEIHT